MRPSNPLSLCLACLTACAGTPPETRPPLEPLPVATHPTPPPDPAPRTDAPPVVILNATIMTAAGATHAPGWISLRAGRIDSLGAGEPPAVPAGAEVIDASGRWVTPGLIDPHSHIGVYPLPIGEGQLDGNEVGNPLTPQVWAEHAFLPQDPGIWRAVSGGVTTLQTVPGSANLVGGRTFTAKLHPATSARAMRFPGAPQGVKMACGENPTRTYGEQGGPHTRMGSAARLRAAFVAARAYQRSWQAYERDLSRWQELGGVDADDEPTDPPSPPDRDLAKDTLVGILSGELLPQWHCYRAADLHVMLDLAEELGFEIRAFHHSLEGYKLADRLAAANVAVVTWADWWGFKLEAYDGVPHNAAIVTAAGGRATLHSDGHAEIRHLNQEAAKAMYAGRELGLAISEDQALRWITLDPAWVLGVDDQTGSLEPGKMADLVIWSGHPFSVYSLAERVFIDGELVFDRARGPRPSDLELGQPSRAEVTP